MGSIRQTLFAGAAALVGLSLLSPANAADDLPKPGEIEKAADSRQTVPASAEQATSDITLSVGKPAPAFGVATWVKGEPIEALKPGQVYVVEFWATWCGPCRAGMPHISKLQTEYGDKVRIIGISDEKESVVREFLTQNRDEGVTWDQTVGYSLAMDPDRKMFDTWFSAAGQSGIPTAFLVGRDGVIEWIGHPGEIDSPLARVIDGTWDRQAAMAAAAKEVAQMKALLATGKVRASLAAALKKRQFARALQYADQWMALTPEDPAPQLMKLTVYAMSGETEMTAAYMADLVKSDWDKGAMLPSLVVGIAAGQYPGDLDEAERLAKRALEVAGSRSVAARHAMAKVFAERGKYDQAVAWERQALEFAENSELVLRTLREYETKKDAGEKPAATTEK